MCNTGPHPHKEECLKFEEPWEGNGKHSSMDRGICMEKGDLPRTLAHHGSQYKSEEKRLETCRSTGTFPEVFSLRLAGVFHQLTSSNSKLIWYQGAANLYLGAPYRLARDIENRSSGCMVNFYPSEMKELEEQLQELSDKGFYKPQLFTLGSPGLVRQEERRIVLHVPHRIIGT
ncbi:hypothetical protein Tco_0126466 [Tanacetum coccineum]